MGIFIFIVINLLLVGIGTAALAVALLFAGGEGVDRDTLLKCLGIVVVATLISYVPVIGFMSGIIWFAGIMAAFEKTFLEALLIAVVCWVISIGTKIRLAMVASMFV